MTRDPRALYARRQNELEAERDGLLFRLRRLSLTRTVTFLVGFALWVAADLVVFGSVLRLGTGVALAAFALLVVRHRRSRARLERVEAGLAWVARGLARLDRRWEALPAPEAPRLTDLPDPHPYAVDLDLYGPASLASLLGPVHTPAGREMLGRWLLAPSGPEGAARRQVAVRELAGRESLLESLGVEGALYTAGDGGTPGGPGPAYRHFLAWCTAPRPVPFLLTAAAWVLPLVTAGLVAGHLAGSLSPRWWILTLVVQGVLGLRLGSRYHRDFATVSDGLPGLEGLAAVIRTWEAAEVEAPLLREAAGCFDAGDGPASRAIEALRRRVHLADMRLSSIYPVFSVGLLWDFHVARALESWRRRHGSHVAGWLESLAMLEALSALAVLGHDHPAWCYPGQEGAREAASPSPGGTEAGEAHPGPVLRARGLGHPLIPPDRCVHNDVEVGPPGTVLLVTGSNMSGKSTLLRSIGLAAVLGRAGAPVCASALALPPLRLHTSMRVQDSLEAGVSFFMAELLRLRSILEAAAAPGPPLLYLVDEILQGTNSEERQVAGRRLIRHLLRQPAIGAVTTHDLELHRHPEVEAAAHLVHFREALAAEGESLTFDYRLRPGLATTRNALALAERVGLTEPEGEAAR